MVLEDIFSEVAVEQHFYIFYTQSWKNQPNFNILNLNDISMSKKSFLDNIGNNT